MVLLDGGGLVEGSHDFGASFALLNLLHLPLEDLLVLLDEPLPLLGPVGDQFLLTLGLLSSQVSLLSQSCILLAVERLALGGVVLAEEVGLEVLLDGGLEFCLGSQQCLAFGHPPCLLI